MREDKATLRNLLIIGGTVLLMLLIFLIMARGIG